MQISLIGYGKMGKAIESLAKIDGYDVAYICDNEIQLKNVVANNSVCIDFTEPKAFFKNYKIIADKFSAAVVGTTGWEDIKDEVCSYFQKKQKTLIYASNFSLGMNVFFKLVALASEALNNFDYDPYILEMHHKEKKDSPSGTAKTIANILKDHFEKNVIPSSVRCGGLYGTHEVGYNSPVDTITIRHEAHSRESLARGALLAAKMAKELSGVYDFKDILFLPK